MLTIEKMKKLPKWAQYEVEMLQFRIKKLERDNLTIKLSRPETNTAVVLEDFSRAFLPDYARVEFQGYDIKVAAHVHPDGYVRIDLDDGVIIPSGRNCIHILDRRNKRNL